MPLPGHETTCFEFEADRIAKSRYHAATVVSGWLAGMQNDKRLRGIFGPTYGEVAKRIELGLIRGCIFFQVSPRGCPNIVGARAQPLDVHFSPFSLPVAKTAVIFQVQEGISRHVLNRMGEDPLYKLYKLDRGFSTQNGRIFPHEVKVTDSTWGVFPTYDFQPRQLKD